jgi:hypothetical protein
VGKPSRWRRAQPIPIATEAPSQPEHGHAGGPGHARLGHVYAQQRDLFVEKARDRRMRRCWPARDVAERRHSRMKQGDGGAASTGRDAGSGWTLDKPKQRRTKITIHMPVMDLFFPHLYGTFFAPHFGFGYRAGGQKQDFPQRHLLGRHFEFRLILGSLFFGACCCTLPNWRFSGTKSYISFPCGF